MSAVVWAPSRVEAAALARGASSGLVQRCGVGKSAAERAGSTTQTLGVTGVAVAGVGGGLQPGLAAGDVVVASEVRGGRRTIPCPSAPIVAAALRRRGLTVHIGPVVSAYHVVAGAERAELAATGALVVDMESAWLLERVVDGAGDAPPVAVVRVVADVAESPMLRPATLGRLGSAVRTLAAVGPVLAHWADALGEREILLAGPRSFCAGVVRAIDVVEKALEQRGAPVYVRKQIVHNVHVVHDLQQRGAIFVDELHDVPDGAVVVFSAHGVSPEVRIAAAARDLDVIDATCPLVSKVHSEVRRFADAGDTVVFIGHAGHEETVGTMGERPGNTVLIEGDEGAESVDVPDPEHVSYLVQTTLAADEVAGVVDILQRRFPKLRGPASADICYATTNRQQALQAVAVESDLALVIGSQNSSNSVRLVEKSQRLGTPAYLIDDASDIDLGWLAGANRVALTAGASAPTALVDDVITAIGGLGSVAVTERDVTTENVHFTLPKEVRQP